VLTHRDKPAGPPGIPRQPARVGLVGQQPPAEWTGVRQVGALVAEHRTGLRLHLLRGETAAEITLEDRLPADQPPLEKPLPLESE
jgi:hypothetical protein